MIKGLNTLGFGKLLGLFSCADVFAFSGIVLGH